MDFLDIVSKRYNKVRKPVDRLFIISSLFMIHYALYAAIKLRIPDYLNNELSTGSLAKLTKANPRALYRLLRTIATVGIVYESKDNTFRLTKLGRLLREDSPNSIRGWVEFTGEPYYRHCWEKIVESIKTGKPVWEKVHGLPMFEYLAANERASKIFDSAMTNLSNIEAPVIVKAYDFNRHKTIVDIGGGQGHLLATILRKYPRLNGILFDYPHVLAKARAYFASRGLSSRSKIVGGDFFSGRFLWEGTCIC